MDRTTTLPLSPDEIRTAFADPTWSSEFPPLLSVDQAARLAQVPKATIYDWSSRGLLRGCSRRVGKYLRIIRDRFYTKIINEGIQNRE
jgi:hypothetical protein